MGSVRRGSVLLYVMLLSIFIACGDKSADQSTSEVQPASSHTFTIVQNEDQTFGYQIYEGEKLMVNQSTVPALPGNSGFASREQAARMAEVVLKKIEQGIFPPTVSPEEVEAVLQDPN